VDLVLLGFELSLGLFDFVVEVLELVLELLFLVCEFFVHVSDGLL
jgi:hypothetical protein